MESFKQRMLTALRMEARRLGRNLLLDNRIVEMVMRNCWTLLYLEGGSVPTESADGYDIGYEKENESRMI